MQTITIEKGITARQFWPDLKYIVKYAFTIGEKHYFEHEDKFKSGYQRALSAIYFYDELGKRMTAAYLKAGLKAAMNCLTVRVDKEQGVMTMRTSDADQIIKLMYQRTELPPHPDMMYNLCSVVFFDQFEHPDIYEEKHGAEKIALWKSLGTLESPHLFFLTQPIENLIPYIKVAGENFEAFNSLIELRNTKELAYFNSFL